MFHSLSNYRLSSSSDSEGHGERADKHHALHEVLSVIRRVQHGEAIQQNTDKDRAHHRAADVRPSRIENRVTNQKRGPPLEHHGRSGENFAAADARSREDAAKRAENTRNDISRDAIFL